MHADLMNALAVLDDFIKHRRMSGHAGVQLLERRFEYSYQENFRRKVRGEDYADYWATKRAYFDAVLAGALPKLQQLDAQLLAADLPLGLIDPTREHNLEVELTGERGTTALRFQVASPLTDAQRPQLDALVAAFDFALLATAWEQAGRRPARAGQFVPAIAVAATFPKYALALFLIRQMRSDVAHEMRAKLDARLVQLGRKIEPAMNEKLAAGQTWVDPSGLVSFAEKFGAQWQARLNEQNPAASIFNPYGPLHDERGRRTSSQAGATTAVMLFLNQHDNWPATAEYGRHTAAFEQWFHETTRY